MKKTLTSVLLSLILTLTASGCAPELYERLLISAIGVDRTATGCRVTVLASETTEDGGQSTFSGEGDTVPEALSQIALESGRTAQMPCTMKTSIVIVVVSSESE